MKVRDLLAHRGHIALQTVTADHLLFEAAGRMAMSSVGALIVLGPGGNAVGIVSERDLIRVMASRIPAMSELAVGNVMTRRLITCTADHSVAEVLALMKQHNIRHMPVTNGEVPVDMVSMRELTRAYEMAEAEANTDMLTGLHNRRSFQGVVEGEVARAARYARPLSVAMLDIDHFKKINDGYGHAAGDRVIRALADLLVQELRTVDEIGRIGGEEFAICFPETDLASATIACERLLNAIRAARVVVDGQKISFTASIGLTTLSSAGGGAETPAAILDRADKLLYAAKSAGRDCLRADPNLAAVA